jgi:hypothetical protein
VCVRAGMARAGVVLCRGAMRGVARRQKHGALGRGGACERRGVEVVTDRADP